MAIKQLNKVHSTEALVYDHIFMDEMRITQRRIANEKNNPLYDVHVTYRMYAIDSDGNHRYANKNDTLIVKDFYAKALELLNSAGDMAFINAMNTIQDVVAHMIKLELGVDTEII